MMRARQDPLRGVTRLHDPSTYELLIVLVVDELAALTAWTIDREAKRRIAAALGLLLSQGRAVRLVVVGAVQDPRKEVLTVRGLFPTRIALRLSEAEQVNLVLGPGARNRGALCDQISDRLPERRLCRRPRDRRTRPGPLLPHHRPHHRGIGQGAGAAGCRADSRGAGRVSSPVLVGGLPRITATMARELAVAERVCIRPMIRRVLDTRHRHDGGDRLWIDPRIALSAVCGEGPGAADAAMRRRMAPRPRTRPTQPINDQDDADDQDQQHDIEGSVEDRRARSTRRRRDAPDLPRVAQEDRTIGQTLTAPDGTVYRPSMFLTLTLPSYGPIIPGTGTPAVPGSYDYRRAALDALHFSKLVDRFWQNLRRSAGYRVQYFAALEPQKRLAPHLHAAIRGATPRATLGQVIKATYVQVVVATAQTIPSTPTPTAFRCGTQTTTSTRRP